MLLIAAIITWVNSPPSLIEKWSELRDYIIDNDIDDSYSIYGQANFSAPEWNTSSIHPSLSNNEYVEQVLPLIEFSDRPWTDEDYRHWSAGVSTESDDGGNPGYSYSGRWQNYATNCLELIEDKTRSGDWRIALDHLIEVNSPAFSEWTAYTDPIQIIRQLETQALIAKRTALMLNAGKVHPTPDEFTTLSAQVESWNPISNWSTYVLGIRDTLASSRGWHYERQSENRSQAKREATALLTANLESMKILERAAQIGRARWTRSKIIESKRMIARELEAAKAASPFTRYPMVWDNPARWIAENEHDIAAYDQWVIDKSLYQTFLAARQFLQTDSAKQTPPTLAILHDHLDKETLTTLDQLNASIITWKWNLGHKIAIKHTLPNGSHSFWPEAPPK